MTNRVYGVRCKTKGCDGRIPIHAPAKEIFKPNVVVTGTCKKCGKKDVYEEGDVILVGQIIVTESVSPSRK